MYDRRYVAKRREPEREPVCVIEKNVNWLREVQAARVSISGFRGMIGAIH